MRFGVSEHQEPRDRSGPRTLKRTRNVCRLLMSNKVAVTTPMSKRINVILLKDRLKESYLADAKLNLELAREWFPLEEEAWRSTQRRKQK